MFNSVYFGIAYAIGGFVGGILLENLGIKQTFLWGGVFVLVGALTLWIVSNFAKSLQANQSNNS